MSKATGIKILAAVLAVLLLYAALGFLLAPRLVESRLKGLTEERLGQPLELERLRINPFALSAEATGIRLEQPGGQPTIAARRIYLNFSLLSSGFGRGWVLGEAQADGLQVEADFDKNGRLNIAKLAERWNSTAAPAAAGGGAPPRVVLKHLLIPDGSLTLRDLSGSSQAAEQAVPIRIELVNLATLPDETGRYNVSAQFVTGGSLAWQGDLSLMPVRSEGELTLQGLPLAGVWQFFRDEVRIAKPAGTLDFAARYRFVYSQGTPDVSLSAVRVKAAALNIATPTRPLLAMSDVEADDGEFRLASRELVLRKVLLREGRLSAAMSADGVLDWTTLLVTSSGAPPAKRDVQAAAPWRIRLEGVHADKVSVHYEDRDRPMPLALDLGSMRGSAAVDVTLSNGSSQVRAHDMDVELERLSLAPLDKDTPGVQIGALAMNGVRMDLEGHAFSANRMTLKGGSIPAHRGKDGSMPLLQMLQGPDKTKDEAPWKYAVNEARIEDVDVSFSDRSLGQPIDYRLSGVSARIENIAPSGAKQMMFEASARLGQGSIGANGSAAQDLSQADARLKLSGLELPPLQPLIARYADVTLVSGRASADAKLAYRNARGKHSFTAGGAVSLDAVQLDESGSRPVLAWKRLSSADVRLSFAPDRLAIKEIVLDGLETRVAISEQRDLNLAQLLKSPDKTASAGKAETASTPRFPVSVGALRVRHGTVDYSDSSLVLPYAARVEAFQGTATGLSNNPERRAALEFQGDIGEFGAAHVKGSLNTASPKSFTDIQVTFENVLMPPLSPYSATFLGRKLASGRLWMDLDYKIVDNRLTGENKITARDLTLGEPVKSPSALDVPLDLAVALLTDSQGRITAAIPVSGDLGNPQFAIGPAVRAAFANLLRRIVSAPFRALAGLLGSRHGEALGSIAFDPGSSNLPSSEREKLQEVAKALRDRPTLRLVLHPGYDPKRDARALSEELVRGEIARELGRAPQAGEAPGPIAFDNPAAQRALERLLDQRDTSAGDVLAGQFERRTGHAPRRVGILLPRSGDADFYRAVFDRLAETQPLPEAAERSLAARREQAIKGYLQSAGIPADRIQSQTIEANAGQEDGRVSQRLSLQAASDLQNSASKSGS